MLKIYIGICVLSYFAGICSSEPVHCGKRNGANNKIPWHVILRAEGPPSHSPDCGGTILNELYVITAGHCLFDLSGGAIEHNQLRVFIHRRNGIEELLITKIFVPAEFTVESFEADVAILKLKSRIDFDDDVGPVCFMDVNQFMTKNMITVPIARDRTIETNIVQWKVTSEALCHGTNRYIFGSSYNHSICMGNLLNTDKFQLNRGSGMVVERNGSWHLVGVLLYTVGPGNISTYGGGIDVSPFSNWIGPIIKRHVQPSISDTMCQYYKEIAKGPKSSLFTPTITLRGKVDYNSEEVCYGTLISERFILTAAVCGSKSLEGISMRTDIVEGSYHSEYKFHFHPEDRDRQGIALIELSRNVSGMEHFIHCLWTDEDDSFQFTTELVHGMRFITPAKLAVSYNPEQDVNVKFDSTCSRFTAALVFKPGDALATQKGDETTVKRVVGLINKQINDCRPMTMDNIVNYLPWIEGIVWGK